MKTKSKIYLSHLILSAVKILYKKSLHFPEIHRFTFIRPRNNDSFINLQERLFLKKEWTASSQKKYAVHSLYSVSIASRLKPVGFRHVDVHETLRFVQSDKWGGNLLGS